MDKVNYCLPYPHYILLLTLQIKLQNKENKATLENTQKKKKKKRKTNLQLLLHNYYAMASNLLLHNCTNQGKSKKHLISFLIIHNVLKANSTNLKFSFNNSTATNYLNCFISKYYNNTYLN